MTAYDPYKWERLPWLLAERVEALPPDERAKVKARIELEPFTFSALRLEGGWVEVFVGTDAYGPALSIGTFHLSALAEAPGAVN
jgi:hypothetical protein